MYTADYWIDKLGLIEHPEGGYFGEVYKSSEHIEGDALPKRFEGKRSFSTSIYFLVKHDRFSALHRLQADEIWHFYTGSALEIAMILADGQVKKHHLGPEFEAGQTFQAMVPAGCWFGASVIAQQPEAFALVGCTVAPGFEFADFELGNRTELLTNYPAHKELILSLTRG